LLAALEHYATRASGGGARHAAILRHFFSLFATPCHALRMPLPLCHYFLIFAAALADITALRSARAAAAFVERCC